MGWVGGHLCTHLARRGGEGRLVQQSLDRRARRGVCAVNSCLIQGQPDTALDNPLRRRTLAGSRPSADMTADRMRVPVMIGTTVQGDAQPRPRWAVQSPIGNHRPAVVGHETHRPPRDGVALVGFVGG